MASHESTPLGESTPPSRVASASHSIVELTDASILFSGDAGDGILLAGAQFTNACGSAGNFVYTHPDPPAEIRAPPGTLANVASLRVHFCNRPVHSLGDDLHTLVALNPAALKANLHALKPGGTLVVNSDAYAPLEWQKAGFNADPLDDPSLRKFCVVSVPVDQLNREAVAKVSLNPREADRCKTYFALGLTFYLYERPVEPTLRWIRDTYVKNPAMVEANSRALKAGYQFAEARGIFPTRFRVGKAPLAPGRWRQINGADSLALGLIAAAEAAGLPLLFAGFPTPPACDLLHRFFEWKLPKVTAVQAEDDLAAANMALGASYAGALGATATTSPGFTLQAETIGLGVMNELPGIIIDVQRAGPSTGLPALVEQADLWQAIHGRHGECPLIVLAPATPSDGFAIAIEASRLALRFMTPVVVLTDVCLFHDAESWHVPDRKDVPSIEIRRAPANDAASAWTRDDSLVRPWILPGTPGLEFCASGLEKNAATGNISFDPGNHATMVSLRAKKITNAASAIPDLEVFGPDLGDLLILGWGSTLGAIREAADRCRASGLGVANSHLRHLSPLPRNLEEILRRYRRILIPELNRGQLATYLRSRFNVEMTSLCLTEGRPFRVDEIVRAVHGVLGR